MVDYRPNGRYGKRVRLKLPGSVQTEEAAQSVEDLLKDAAQKERAEKKTPQHYPDATIRDLFEQYLSWFSTNREKATYKDVSSVYYNHIEPILGDYIAEDFNNNHIEIYKKLRIDAPAKSRLKKGTKKTVSKRTVSKELAYISSFLRWAADKGHITRRQFTIDKLKTSRPIPIILTIDEVKRIMAAAEPFWRAYFLFLYTMGLRRNEARMLKWSDIDTQNMTARVIRKGNRMTVIPVNQIVLRALNEVPKVDGSPYIFTNPHTKKPIVNPTTALRRAAKKAKVNKHVNPHLFRHSIATHMLGRQIDLRSVQGYLGHTRIGTTEWYTHLEIEHLTNAANVVLAEYEETDM